MRTCTPKLPRLSRRKSKTEDGSYLKDEQKKVQFYDKLATISWSDLLEEAHIQCEKTCANYRRQTALLDNLEFESEEHKAQIMADLRASGMTLASTHLDWDICIQMGRTITLAWSWYERGSWRLVLIDTNHCHAIRTHS